jgi:hypothetical protein
MVTAVVATLEKYCLVKDVQQRWHLEAETCRRINKHSKTAYEHLLDTFLPD